MLEARLSYSNEIKMQKYTWRIACECYQRLMVLMPWLKFVGCFVGAFDHLGVSCVYWMQVAGVVSTPLVRRASSVFDCTAILKKELLKKCVLEQTQEFYHKCLLVKLWLNYYLIYSTYAHALQQGNKDIDFDFIGKHWSQYLYNFIEILLKHLRQCI